MSEAVIFAQALTKYYGRQRGLAGLDLAVHPGEVFGYLGPNGAGKTTTIRLLLDLIRPTSGVARVFGLDPQRDGLQIRKRVGYLPGELFVDGRQSAGELFRYLGNLRGGLPNGRMRELAERFELDLHRPIRGLSKGNRQKVAVVQAFMHDPELLILDEPTSGLDPLLQREFLDLVREAKAAGRTVFMSSHVMSEVQQSADRVGIVRDGRMVAVEQVETLRDRSVRKVEVHFDEPVEHAAFIDIPGVSDLTLDGPLLRCRLDGRADPLIKAVARYGVRSLRAEEPDLEELFLTYYEDRNHRPDPAGTGAGAGAGVGAGAGTGAGEEAVDAAR